MGIHMLFFFYLVKYTDTFEDACLFVCFFVVFFLFVFFSFEPRHETSNNVVCATIKASDQPALTRILNRAFANRLNIL